jgi:transcriptional regulator of acetoin/glycerol metabolism
MCDGHTIDAHDLHLTAEASTPPTGLPSLKLEDLESLAIRQALRQTHGNLSQTAVTLGIHRDTLGMKIKKYEIDKDNP